MVKATHQKESAWSKHHVKGMRKVIKRDDIKAVKELLQEALLPKNKPCKDSLEKFLRAIGGLIEDDASIKEILGQIAEHYKNSTELELDFEDIVVKIDTEMSALGYAKKVPFVVALIENSKAFLESQGEYISENEKRILRRVIRLSRIEDM